MFRSTSVDPFAGLEPVIRNPTAPLTEQYAFRMVMGLFSGSKFPVKMALLRMICLAWEGVRSEFTENINPATPVTNGAAKEVPESLS